MTLVLVVIVLAVLVAGMFRARPTGAGASLAASALAGVACIALFELGRLDG
jgi:hypothetical protein